MASNAVSPRLHPALLWVRSNLFSSWFNAALTLIAVYFVAVSLRALVDWALVRAVWSGGRDACAVPDAGACWPFIEARLGQIVYGFYTVAERWRVDIVYALGALGLAWLTVPRLPGKRLAGILMLTAYPLLAYVLLLGGWFGLSTVETPRWGGLLLTLVVAAAGIVVSLPLGILLALGRRSDLPIVRTLCIVFIEFWRGVPLITVLFMASNLLPLFLPGGESIDRLVRALIAVAVFEAAYVAEAVRGGLQAIPKAQEEAARALGLGYWRVMGLVILPQALKISIPAIVSSFISLFKDTSLVTIIGLFDLLGIVQAANADPAWAAPNTAATGYIFAAAIYWTFCFSMSRYAGYLERRLETEERR